MGELPACIPDYSGAYTGFRLGQSVLGQLEVAQKLGVEKRGFEERPETALGEPSASLKEKAVQV